MKKRTPLLLAIPTILMGLQAQAANEFQPAMEAYLADHIVEWAQDPVLLDAIRAANAVTGGYSADQIDAMDQAWRSEVGATDTPTITPVLENDAAEFLRARVALSDGAISEVFIMDMVGLNVAASAVTSDMWQGDESKFTATYGAGAGASHFGEVEFDESSQTYQGQISISITDPETGELLGAMTVGVDAEALL